jgi:hypothetical protein
MLPHLNASWRCPFCGHFQVVTSETRHVSRNPLGTSKNKHKARWYTIGVIECSNPNCKEFAAWFSFNDYGKYSDGSARMEIIGEEVLHYQLRPVSMAKPQHASVPSILVTDYEEACLVLHASPKASATLSRRCLQGMIRDFCGIAKATLHQEIAELKRLVETGEAPRQVSSESIEAIDSVRSIGNIGAHFEKDINLIIEVDPDEAQALISLVELLFAEWYVARHERASRLAAVKKVAEAKKQAKATASES